MKEEVQRISRLVAEGKLSPEDAADLIDAFYGSERASEGASGEEPRQTPPPPPQPGAGAYAGSSTGGRAEEGSGRWAHSTGDPVRGIIDSIEKITREGLESVNWQEVSRQARESAKKGLETLKVGLDDLSRGKVNLGWLIATETREVSLPLSVASGKTLRIENPCGDVRIVGGLEVGTVTAHAKFRGATIEESRAKAAEFQLVIEEADHAVTIKQPDAPGLRVDFEIQVAGMCPIEVQSASGDVQVMDTGMGCRISSKSGDINLRSLNGLIELTSMSGDISIEDSVSPQVTIDSKSGDLSLVRLVGNINSRTTSGDVSFVGGGGKVIAMKSVSGDVHLDLTEPINTLNVQTVNGDISVMIPGGADARVSISTMRGDVSAELMLQEEMRTEQRVNGRLGDGTGTIDISAITGDVQLGIHDSVAEVS